MTRTFKQNLSAVLLAFSVCGFSFANPDVFFPDSAAYLKHEIEGQNVKFVLTEKIIGIDLPDLFFAIQDLTDFIVKRQTFADDNLKKEFIRMLRSSFNSQFTATIFLTELVKVLSEFQVQKSAQSSQPVPISDGCCASIHNVDSLPFEIIAGMFFLLMMQRGRRNYLGKQRI